ncbi:restriction endonuclease subunit S [Streptomyces sp. JV186]|uniref:restriction endonuclease subunit S n=1 Tax=Streptomyces sp. JV186 TaxID=858639 RepID=UPI002E76F688|nr:restriction endonuclease subunit S [Streptomyces sp. JV186]MEE1725661.1 restriction endonuclease subunit S [Streptomyces sp. JV186]
MTDSGAGESVASAPGERLPEGWVRATLGELGVEAQPGFSSGRHNRDGKGIIHLRPMNVTSNGVLDTSDARYVHDDTDRRVVFGDVLFNNTNSPVWVGKTAWVDSVEPLAYSNHMTRLRGPEGLDGKFLAVQLHHLWAIGHFKAVLNNHVNQASVARKALLDTSIVVPPLPEQRRIVAKLDKQLAHIEVGEAAVSSAIALRQSLRDALLNLYVLGCNQESSLESVQEIQAQSSRKIPYGDLLPLPHAWKWRVAQEVCPLITSGSTPEASLMHSGFGEIPFLKVYNIDKRNGVDFSIRPTFVDRVVHEGKLKKSRVAPGDVLTNIVGPPLGKTAVVPKDHAEWNINQAIVAFRAGPELLPEWLRLVLLSPYVIGLLLKTARATAGQFNIALSTCRELPIPVPPLAVQRQLCEFLSVKLAEFDSLDQGVDEVAEQPTELRGALLHAAFNGTLVPQDPADEPASALLDRIRVQRQAAVKPARKRTPRKTTSKPASSGQEELPL